MNNAANKQRKNPTPKQLYAESIAAFSDTRLVEEIGTVLSMYAYRSTVMPLVFAHSDLPWKREIVKAEGERRGVYAQGVAVAEKSLKNSCPRAKVFA